MSEKSGKSRAQRIRLDYHKQLGWLDWSRWISASIVFSVAVLYGLAVVSGAFWKNAPGLRPASQLSTGRLAEVHAYVENDCQACHASSGLVPIAQDAFKPDVVQSANHQKTACQRCHSVAPHVAGPPTDSTCRMMDDNCSSCHQDHRGRDIDLAKVSAARCTHCHRDLSKVCGTSGSDRPVENTIGDFSLASHRVFRSLQADRGRIKFDHSQHLLLGQVEPGNSGRFSTSMLSAKWQGKYRAGNKEGHIKLDCSDCHQLESSSGSREVAQQDPFESASGLEFSNRYAPIDFEQHCEACHELTYTGQSNDDLPLPHAATFDEIRVLLAAKLAGGRVTGKIRMRAESEDASQAERSTGDLTLTARVNEVFSNCSKCHQPDDVTPKAIDERRTGIIAAAPLIPSAWLKVGFYNHGAHEKITECAFCHEVTELSADPKPTDNERVMIKGVESCVACHRDPTYKPEDAMLQKLIDSLATDEGQERLLGTAPQPTLASDECILCHRYHWSSPAQVTPLGSLPGADE